MRKFKVRGVAFLIFGALAALAAGAVTMGLWNMLMPGIFGLRTIGFAQGLGLLLLCRLLFGRFHGFRRRGRFPRFASELSPEERERIRRKLTCGCKEARM